MPIKQNRPARVRKSKKVPQGTQTDTDTLQRKPAASAPAVPDWDEQKIAVGIDTTFWPIGAEDQLREFRKVNGANKTKAV